MHPVKPTAAYMREVIAAARVYCVDSFEVCGDVHSSTGSLDGAIFFHDYPAAAARINRNAVTTTIATLNEVVALAHQSDRPIYYWHREVMVPRAVVETVPGLLDEDGEFNLLGAAYHELIRSKLREFFANVPAMDGLVLTVTESDYSVIHNSNPERYPPALVIERVVTTFAEELKARGKRFILRSFGSIAQDYEDILAGAERVNPKFAFEIETKITPYDFSPFMPLNPFLRKSNAFTLSAEHDSIGEFLGAGYLPAPDPARVIECVAHAAHIGVDRHAIRVDRIGHATFASTQAINLLAYDRAIQNPRVAAESIWSEWAATHWPGCADEMTSIMQRGIEVVKKTHFIDGHVIFHAFPLDASQKWVKASGILSLFQPGLSLAKHQGMWGILPAKHTPSREFILEEKDAAVRLADECLQRLLALKDRLSPAEFTVAETAWRNATVVSRLIREWCRCVCAYLADIEAERPGHPTLTAAIRAAQVVFEQFLQTSLPLDVSPRATHAPVAGHAYDHDTESEDCIESAYARPLWKIITSLIPEFLAEQKERTTCAALPGITDFVVCGGIAHDARALRYMHASHAFIVEGRLARAAGNRVFPNGFFECHLATPALSKFQIIISGHRAQSPGFLLTVDGQRIEALYDKDGRFVFTLNGASDAAIVTVRIQKLGAHYPWIHHVAVADVSD